MSDKNFKVKNGIDAVGPITISPSSNSIDGIVINTLTGGKAIRFIRVGSGEVASIDEWGGFVSSGGISVAQPWYTRTPGLESQSFFWAASSTRSAAGFGGTSTGTNPVVYISSHGSGVNDLTQWVTPNNTILAKVDYLGNVTANDLTLAGNLTVNGTTTNLNSTNLIIEDKNIIIADVATPTNTTADGAGITIKGATDKTFNWVQSTGRFTSSEPIQSPSLVISTPTNMTNAGTFYNSAGTPVFNVDTSLNAINIGGGLSGTANNFASTWGYDSVLNAGYMTFQTGALGSDSLAMRRTNYVASGDYTISTLGNMRLSTAGGKNFNFNNGNIGVATTAIGTNNKIIVNPYSTVDNLATVQINTNAATNKGLVIQGYTSQTANLQEWQDSAGTVNAFVNSSAQLAANRVTAGSPTIQTGARLFGVGGVTTDVVLGLRGAASATGDYVRMFTNAGVVMGGYNALGQSFTGSTTPILVATGGATTAASGDGTTATVTTTSAHGLAVGDLITIAGITPTGYNATALLTAVASTTISYLNATTGAQTIAGTVSAPAQASVTARSAGTRGLIIKGAASQTANLQEWQDSAGAVNASMTSLGRLNLGGAGLGSYSLTIRATDAIILHSPDNTSAIKSNTAYTRGNTGGTPMYLGSIGDTANGVVAITTTSGAGSTSITSFGVNGNIVTNLQSASAIGLIVKGAASQTADLQQWQTSAGQTNLSVNFGGALQSYIQATADNINSGITSFIAKTSYANVKPMIVQGAASQTASLMEWQDSAGTMLANVSSSGQFLTPRLTITNGGNIVDSAGTTPYFGFGSNQIVIFTRNAAYKGLVIKGMASQTANLQEWQTDAGIVRSFVTSHGRLGVRLSALASGTESLSVGTLNPTDIGILVKGFASQTAYLQEWQNSAGTMLANVDPSGHISTSGFVALGINAGIVVGGSYVIRNNYGSNNSINIGNSVSQQTAAQVQVTNSAAGIVGLIVKGAASQTAKLQEWQDSAGAVRASINNSGVFETNSSIYTPFIQPVNGGGSYLAFTSGSPVTALPTSASVVPFAVKGAASQTANLQEWQNSSANVSLAITPDGSIKGGNSSTISANTATTIDTVPLSSFTTIEYTISIKQGSKVRSSKVLVHTDGTSIDSTEYGIMEMGGGITGILVTASVSSTNSILQVTITDAATTNATVKLIKTML